MGERIRLGVAGDGIRFVVVGGVVGGVLGTSLLVLGEEVSFGLGLVI